MAKIEYTQSGTDWVALYKGKEIGDTPIEKSIDESVPKWFQQEMEMFVKQKGTFFKSLIKRKKGWHYEGVRHYLAAKGIKTGRKKKGKEIFYQTSKGIITIKPKEKYAKVKMKLLEQTGIGQRLD